MRPLAGYRYQDRCQCSASASGAARKGRIIVVEQGAPETFRGPQRMPGKARTTVGIGAMTKTWRPLYGIASALELAHRDDRPGPNAMGCRGRARPSLHGVLIL